MSMDLFKGVLGNKKKKASAKSSEKRSSGNATKPKKTNTPQQSKEISSSLLEKRQSSSIKSIDEIPENLGALKSDDGDFLTDKESEQFSILKISEKEEGEEGRCILLISSKRIKVPIDNQADRIKSRIKRASYRVVKTYYIEGSLLGDINKKQGSRNQGDSSEIAKEFDDILKYACDNSISDIHFEVTEDKAVIRVRRNSLLEDYTQMGVDYAFDFCTVVYQVLSESESTDISFLPRKQQSSVIVRDIPGHGVVRVRLNTIPTAPSGFDMVLRVLKSGGGGHLTLEQLGYNRRLVKSLELASAKPVGALIIAGTTGSGKSTTLKTLLEDKVIQFSTPNGVTIKIITVEDPPEYDIKGVSQCNVSTSKAAGDENASKNPFRDAIKAAMRCDPDILMAGEVRDEDSAELLMHITLSGHQVMTTIHASSAISIIARLRNNGVPNDALGNSDFLSALVYQKLVPKVCHNCAESFSEFKSKASQQPDIELIGRINQVIPDGKHDNILFRNNKGCDSCTSGVVGQTVVAEVILPDHEMLTHFISGEDHKAWHHHKAMGGDTIIDHAHEKIIEGICDPRDIEVKIGLITMDLVMDDSKFEYSEMEKHGIKEDSESLEFISPKSLNDVRRAKVSRAVKLINTKSANNEIEGLGDNCETVLSNMIHNNLFSSSKIAEFMIENGVRISQVQLDEVIEDVKPILR